MDNKALKNKVIITAAVTGAWPKKENNPNVPMTPQEIADDVYACWKAGAAVAHLHMRDDNGNGTMDKNKFIETVNLIHERYPDCDIILNLTTSGDIYIGAPETYVMHSIAEIFKRMHNQYPNIKYHIFSGSTLEVSEQLNKGLLDFAILIEPIDLEKYNYLKLPYTDTWGVLMRRDSPLAKLNAITPEDIKDEPIFLAHQQSSANVLSGWFKEYYRNLNVIGSFNLITTPAMIVESGLGYVFTFDKLINTTGDCNLCFRPLEPNFETGFYLVWKKYQIFSRSAKMFLEELQKVLF